MLDKGFDALCAENRIDTRSPFVGLRSLAFVSSVGSLEMAISVSKPVTFCRTFCNMLAVNRSVGASSGSEDAETRVETRAAREGARWPRAGRSAAAGATADAQRIVLARILK